MFAEIWDYLTTPAGRNARKLGYLYYSVALTHRARRCGKNWGPHLTCCREVLDSAIQNSKTFRLQAQDQRTEQNPPPTISNSHLCVLGSGLMLETPLDKLQSHFSQISLVDIIHPKEIRKKAQGSSGIHLVECDLNSLNKSSDLSGALTSAQADTQTDTQKFDFAISANLLSQLPVVVSQNMRRQKFSEEEIQIYALNLQQRHLDTLKILSPHGLLFSDFEMQIFDKENEIVETAHNVAPDLNIAWQNQWIWELAPLGEVSAKYGIRMKVGSFTW